MTFSVLVAALALAAGRASAADDPPLSETGETSPALAPLDALMRHFVTDNQVPGAALAVSRKGQLVYSRGFGLADSKAQRPVLPDTPFRIASVSKPLTAVAVLQLVEQGKLSLDEHILARPGLTALVPADSDPRLLKITLRHLLHHTAGWDRGVSFDPIATPQRIARELQIKTPIPPLDVVRFTLRLPLDFDPGARYAYANVDYLVLGKAIELVSGIEYEQYVREKVLKPLGITQMRLGRALPADRPPLESRYYDGTNHTFPSLYPANRGELVPGPDGAENFEGYQAHGGWIASAEDLVRFAIAFDDPQHCPLLKPETVALMASRPEGAAGFEDDGSPRQTFYGLGWQVRVQRAGANLFHSGLIGGTSSLLVHRYDGVNWAVLFNTDRSPDNAVLSSRIDPLIHVAVAESGLVELVDRPDDDRPPARRGKQ